MSANKIILTGANGTIGREFKGFLQGQGVEVIPWNRQEVSVDDYQAMLSFVQEHQPNALYHLAQGSNHWIHELSWICRTQGVRFIYSSTVMVFHDHHCGPFKRDTPPNALSGYGFSKRQAEEICFRQNPDAVVVRLGWQIGEAPGSNNMVDHLDQHMRQNGEIEASSNWFPACSFIQDTVVALWNLREAQGGIYHLDANRDWSYFQIATALNVALGHPWSIVPAHNPVWNQQLAESLPIPPLSERLPALEH